MKPEDYILNVLRTESLQTFNKDDTQILRGLHSAAGLVTEAGELMDAFKKHIFYGKPLDFTNVKEELGDLCWYISLMIDVLRKEGVDTSWEDIMERNIAKLRARYGEKFSSERAINRDLETERKILEKED